MLAAVFFLLPVTFSADVAPILSRHCVSCHQAGEVGPFALVRYQDAARRARQIAEVTSRRYMPPWKADPAGPHFRGERRLSDAEIEVLRRWADSGALQGDPAVEVKVAPRTEWHSGTPDTVVTMSKPHSIEADARDEYVCFALKIPLDSTKYLRAIEFQPGNRRVVHHVVMVADGSGTARERDSAGDGYRCFGGVGFIPSGGLGGWSPGNGALEYPAEAPLVLHRGSDIVIQVHYHATGKEETDLSRVGLYFSPKPPARHLFDIPLGSQAIDIPAGASNYKVTDSFVLPVDTDVFGIFPHAHYLCKEMKGWAELPDGSVRTLLLIRDWDFNWQDQYWLEEPMRLPEGTRVRMEFRYDNSAENPHNPSHPPKEVFFGPETTDEMAGLHIQVMPADVDDTAELTQALWGKMMRTLGGQKR